MEWILSLVAGAAKVGEVETTAGPWALDTSTGSEILVKGGCSVIEGEDARYLLRLIAADTSTPAPDAVARLVEAMKHLHDIINCGNCSGSRQSARLALRALKGDA